MITSLKNVNIRGIENIPFVKPDDNLSQILIDSVRENEITPEDNDIIIVTSKIVSKAEGQIIQLDDVTPGQEAIKLAKKLHKNPQLMELILQETKNIVKADHDVFICENRLGLVCANAGVDESNLSEHGTAILLPVDPDKSAKNIRKAFLNMFKKDIGVVISDSFGRPWRQGVINVAIGISGVPGIVDIRGQKDYSGKELIGTTLAVGDELAAVAGLVMGKLDLIPAAWVQGLDWNISESRADDIQRPADEDLFR